MKVLKSLLIKAYQSLERVIAFKSTFKTISLKSEDLDKYVGIYSSTMMPLKITVSKNGSELNAQATGQGAFPLSATETDTFVFNATGIVMVFNPSKNEFILKQGPGNYLFTKEK